MPAQPAAEQQVDAERAALLVGRAFPQLRGQEVRLLAEGWDNTVHLVGDDWLFRFPRRGLAVPGVRREIAVLPRLASALPLPVPVPRFLGTPSADYPWPFWGAAVLSGRELADAGLPEDRREAAAAALGGFLRQLHDTALVADLADLAGLPVDANRRADMAFRVAWARDELAALAAESRWETDARVVAVLGAAERLPPSTAPLVLVHGDLHTRHLLVADGQASGVIDWGDVGRADPAVDLPLAYCGFSGPARAAFFAAYGSVDEGAELRARALGIGLSAVLARDAAATGRAAALTECLAGIARAGS